MFNTTYSFPEYSQTAVMSVAYKSSFPGPGEAILYFKDGILAKKTAIQSSQYLAI